MEKLDIKLLLVEDDAVIRNIYKQILGQLVVTLFIASNGEEGYRSYLNNSPDLIITDIKMPVMNGLDMIKKIREEDKAMRIIIMSAYGESRFFINAIEYGVKGFLVKPVETDHLKEVITGQANEILMEKRLMLEAKLRETAEAERKKSEDILKALLNITTHFFTKGINDESINFMLSQTGKTTNVSRVYIFQVKLIEGEKYASQVYEWVADGISEQIDNPELKDVPLFLDEFRIFEDQMTNRLNVTGHATDFDEPLRSIFKAQDIKSLLTIPIYVSDAWWGFIGFDDCIREREWSVSEINALNMLSLVFGGALFRGEVEKEMKLLNSQLEERVFERTKELENEIKEKTYAQELLKDSEEKYRLIFENANDGIFLLIDRKIVFTNPKVSEIFGELPRDIIASKLDKFIKYEFLSQINRYFDTVKKPFNDFEIQAELINGNWVAIKSTSLYWDSEPAFLVFMSDITKRKNAEKELFKLNEYLERRITEELERANLQQQLLVQKSKLESIGELSAGLAHEINQPLGGLSMGLDNINFHFESGATDETYVRSKIDILFKDIDRIRKIIEHVRIFSREQDNMLAEAFNPKVVIDNALSLVNRQFIDRRIEIIQKVEEDIEIIGNPFRLEQVVLNILSNARHAVEEKGRRLNDENYGKRINIELYKAEPDMFLIISDNGIGVDKKVISKVFDPFFTTKSQEKGTGLGLSISYGIISEMKGSIEIDSELDAYTRMIIKLPLANKIYE